MKIDILASGSAGNCIAITYKEKTILIDIGIAKTKVEKALASAGILPFNVEAIFITHAHGDHVKGLPFAKKFEIPVYATAGEWKSIKSVDLIDRNVAEDGIILLEGNFEVTPFDVHHDSIEPVGYTVEHIDGPEKVSICLDTGQVTDAMIKAMSFSDHYIIEANHEPDLLYNSSYPNSIKARIISHIGHLSNEQTAAALSALIQGQGEKVYLVHLSNSNNTPAIARMEVTRVLMGRGYMPGKHYQMEVIT